MSLRSLSRLALALVVLFAVLVAGALLPFQPLDAAWQSRFCKTLLDTATLPLLALAVLQIGVFLDPSHPAVLRRQRRFSRLACAAALGYLLLIPLQISSSLRLQQTISSAQWRRVEQADRQFSRLRQAVRESSSADDMAARLAQLSGPLLTPANRTLPLPVLKAQVNAAIDQALNRIARERSRLPNATPLRLLPDLLRLSIGCLALAFGFAAFAARPGRTSSLLDDSQTWLMLQRRRRSPRNAGGPDSEENYVRRISGQDD